MPIQSHSVEELIMGSSPSKVAQKTPRKFPTRAPGASALPVTRAPKAARAQATPEVKASLTKDDGEWFFRGFEPPDFKLTKVKQSAKTR